MKYSTKVGSLKSRIATVIGVAVIGSVLLVSGVASADKLATSVDASTSGTTVKASTSLTATQQTHLQNIINKGDTEIDRRLTNLNTLTGKVNAAAKLTASDKTALTNEVGATISGLTSLKAQLDGETTLTAAITDAQDIYTEYRVYAVVNPKVSLIKVADDQQAVQAKLTTLSQKLQTRITAEQQAGKDVSALQSDLSDMDAKISAAQATSSNIESTVISVEPSDYNSNHAVLSGDNTQLQTAHTDDAAATTDAKNIVTALKGM